MKTSKLFSFRFRAKFSGALKLRFLYHFVLLKSCTISNQERSQNFVEGFNLNLSFSLIFIKITLCILVKGLNLFSAVYLKRSDKLAESKLFFETDIWG